MKALNQITSFLFAGLLAFVLAATIGIDPIIPVAGAAVLAGISQLSAVPVGALFTGVPMNIMDIEKKAKELSSYDGQNYLYTGEGDDLLDFMGGSNFGMERNISKQFTVKLVNVGLATRTSVLFAGYFHGNSTEKPGQIINGAFTDKNGDAGLTGSVVSGESIDALQSYLLYSPTRLIGMKIQSTDATQIDESLVYQKLSPFRVEPSSYIRPSDFINQDSNQDKQVTFPVNVQLDSQSVLELPIVAESTAVITFYLGASLNLAKGLETKAKRAQTNIQIINGSGARNSRSIGA